MIDQPKIQQLEFWKLSGSGNDFVCLDNRDGALDALLGDPVTANHFTKTLCARGHGIGADGVIVAGKSEVEKFADLGARFFEADGSECELCGNGTGCFTRFAIDAGLAKPDGQLKILTPAGVIVATTEPDGYIRVCIPSPQDQRRDLKVSVGDKTFICDFAVTGVPHLITYVDDIDAVDVERWGKALRFHEDFAPRGVNVNFVQIIEEGSIAVRTFEFGVEAETLACGTGSSAAAIMSAIRNAWDGELVAGAKPVQVKTRGGDTLRIYFTVSDGHEITDVCLETVVRPIVHGFISDEFLKEAMNP
ncbi:MAG: diaminopimelate epimerase [Phycisphaerae bacterium]|nr:diaminopimelate epimerase [Phycisphaerae bacterium]